MTWLRPIPWYRVLYRRISKNSDQLSTVINEHLVCKCAKCIFTSFNIFCYHLTMPTCHCASVNSTRKCWWTKVMNKNERKKGKIKWSGVENELKPLELYVHYALHLPTVLLPSTLLLTHMKYRYQPAPTFQRNLWKTTLCTNKVKRHN